MGMKKSGLDAMTNIPKAHPPDKPPSLEKFRETWQRQILADQKGLAPGAVYVAVAISWHINRDKGGLAWPGIRTLARLVDIGPPLSSPRSIDLKDAAIYRWRAAARDENAPPTDTFQS